MRRLVVAFLFSLAFLVAACRADVTGSSWSSAETCYAAMAGQDQNGAIIVWVQEFKPCPTDAEFRATGWTRVPRPDWWPDA